MFSARTRWDRTSNALAQRLEAARAGAADLRDLTRTNPTRVGLAPPAQVLRALSDPEGRFYDPEPQGLLAARRAVAADYARRGRVVDPEQVLLTSSTSEAYGLLFKLLCEPGETVLVPRPSYPLFEYLAGLEGVRLRHYPLRYDGSWHVDNAALRRELGADVRAVVVVSPNNPTGSFVRAGEREALAELCAEREVAVISDEVFADFDLRGAGAPAQTVRPDERCLAFSLGGLSKSLGLPQLKLAWVCASGPEPLRREALARLEIVADTYLSVATPIQLALPRLLAQREVLQAPIHARIAANLDALRCALEGGPATLLHLEGGWSAIVRLPATRSDEEWALALLDAGIVVHPGYYFDVDLPACIVLSLLTPPDDLRAGLGVLGSLLGSAPAGDGV